MDIGAGTGDFIEYLSSKNGKVTGVEASLKARCIASTKGLHLKEEISQLEKSFDIITMWHVLEHVYHLKKDVEKIKDILQEDGTLFVAVPNCSSYDALKYGEFWAAYDLPIHLYHFRPNNIRQLFEGVGMEVVDVLPMKFDSYYVSLLSEKYKSGKEGIGLSALIKGALSGFISNMKANKEQYSSQIYVIKHKKITPAN